MLHENIVITFFNSFNTFCDALIIVNNGKVKLNVLKYSNVFGT